jgi:hypothetical protein
MIRAFMLQNQPDEIILRIIDFLDPVSFCKFRLVCLKFNCISYDALEFKKNTYYHTKFDEIEERKYQAFLREKKRGYGMTRDGLVSLRNYENEGLPFGYFEDDYDDYSDDHYYESNYEQDYYSDDQSTENQQSELQAISVNEGLSRSIVDFFTLNQSSTNTARRLHF